jgi:hypothetical protein
MRWRQQSLVWCQYIFLALGLLALGYCAKSLTQAWLYQRWARQRMEKQVSYRAASTPGSATEQQKKTSSTSLGEMSPSDDWRFPGFTSRQWLQKELRPAYSAARWVTPQELLCRGNLAM